MKKTNNKLSESAEKEITKTIQKARINMLMNFPFFGILSLKLTLKIDYSIDTIATNGLDLIYNPNYIQGLSIKEINFYIIHEILHCALRHLSRLNGRDVIKWNYACDYAVNALIINDCNSSILQQPSGALYNTEYINMSAEEIYNILPDNIKETNFDSHPWNNIPKSVMDSCNNDWQTSIINAAKTVLNDKSTGDVPGFMKRYINDLTNPQKDWRILLSEFIEPEPNDYTFTKPDYRIDYDEFGCFLPSFNEEQDSVKKILFWMDTSGSISNKEMQIIYSEITGVIHQFDYFEGYLGFFDAKAYEPIEFNDINSLKEIQPVGGGGTDFNVPFEFTNTHDEFQDIKCQIILTDGYCDFPPKDITDKPTIWLITTKDITAPWGMSIYLPL